MVTDLQTVRKVERCAALEFPVIPARARTKHASSKNRKRYRFMVMIIVGAMKEPVLMYDLRIGCDTDHTGCSGLGINCPRPLKYDGRG
jgi:hypothetical protein